MLCHARVRAVGDFSLSPSDRDSIGTDFIFNQLTSLSSRLGDLVLFGLTEPHPLLNRAEESDPN